MLQWLERTKTRLRIMIQRAIAFLSKLGRFNIPYSWSAAFFQCTAIIGCQILFMFGAVPGISIACLAVVAVVISFRVTTRSFGLLEQTVWILLSAFFLYAEISSISTDRIEADMRANVNRMEEREKFEAVIKQEQAINKKQNQEQRKFAELLQQGQRSIKNLGTVATNVKQATSYASGGDSFATVFPYEVTAADGTQSVGFSVQKRGKYPLYDLEVSVGRPYRTSANSAEVFGTSCSFAELNGNISFPLLLVSMEGQRSAYFTADLEARNGALNEVMDVRRVGKKLVIRWVVFKSEQLGVSPTKVIMDIADADFPPEHRHDALHSALNDIYSLDLPDADQYTGNTDDVLRKKPSNGVGCVLAR